MKRLIAVIIAGASLVALCSCAQPQSAGSGVPGTVSDTVITEEDEETAVDIEIGERVGGWQRAASPAVTDDIAALVSKAADGLDGAEYNPAAYLASQVAAGTNHCVLCKITPIVPDATAHYAVVYIYEDPEGNAKITGIADSGAEVPAQGLMGGWQECEDPAVTEEAKAALDKAVESLTGAKYIPAALLSTQVVAGTNYCLLCEVKPVAPDAASHYSLVYVYEDLDGNASVTDTVDFISEPLE